jgi:8-oxo-dGTP diphosphatase
VTDVRALAADAVVVLDDEVLLMERDHEPYEGTWVLPGGVVEPDETARGACVRETDEEVGLDVKATYFVGLYDDPARDPRGNVSAAFSCEPVDDNPVPEPGEEASAIETFPPEDLPGMGFDHADIVDDAF